VTTRGCLWVSTTKTFEPYVPAWMLHSTTATLQEAGTVVHLWQFSVARATQHQRRINNCLQCTKTQAVAIQWTLTLLQDFCEFG
jgi:hypothetical protein